MNKRSAALSAHPMPFLPIVLCRWPAVVVMNVDVNVKVNMQGGTWSADTEEPSGCPAPPVCFATALGKVLESAPFLKWVGLAA